jgi:membrane-bound serine protease (ClpP class)
VNWWAVALLALAVVLLSIDVQQSHLGGFTVLGTLAALAGSIWFTSTPFYTVRWWAIVLVVGGLVAFYAVAMTTVVRTRFATPTIGREHLVGAAGTVVGRCDPDGFVDIDGAVWKARAHRGRIDEGEPITVRSVNGLLLEIDPDAPAPAEPAGTSG